MMNIKNKNLPQALPSRRVIRGREKEQKVMSKKSNLILRNESGVALVVALLMIVILSLIGLASSSTSTFEIKLSGNKRGVTDAFYTSDAGAQSVMANVGNFNISSGYVNVTTSSLPVELQNELIDQRYPPNPASPPANFFSLPAGISFADAPQVTIYHTTVTKVPRGSGLSAIAFQYNYYIIDAIGEDQMDFSAVKSNCEIREKIVRLIPTGN
jgi:Tfp pilus assembly protein PilX